MAPVRSGALDGDLESGTAVEQMQWALRSGAWAPAEMRALAAPIVRKLRAAHATAVGGRVMVGGRHYDVREFPDWAAW
eukprot:CAMPEP_0183344832 /NCGR_PEP_ID=MMETSP0164_2-20130417/10417_1 /TAXON_ID=221442 /ORGANISM="Coccolithus pelagicus ssp braarudi, Strain PLY182g" /LENGTH=77 /DNA_ID=CAMNT_0025515901 /DNA_START=1 /DNA_END=231 /DNA_ORIENTATION=-